MTYTSGPICKRQGEIRKKKVPQENHVLWLGKKDERGTRVKARRWRGGGSSIKGKPQNKKMQVHFWRILKKNDKKGEKGGTSTLTLVTRAIRGTEWTRGQTSLG